MNGTYDLVIVGMGFAGYSGAIYAARYGLKAVIVGEVFGGQTAEAHIVGNYPGFEEITGLELMQRVQNQTVKLGVTELYERVEGISKNSDQLFTVTLRNGETIKTRAILLTIGVTRKKLGVPGENEFYGKGVTYCATCDGYFYKGKDVAVIGGGDSAVTGALYLADICPTIHLLVRSDKFKAEQYWVDKVKAKPNIKIHFDTVVNSFEGVDTLEKLVVTSTEFSELPVQGAFIEIGHEPNKLFTDAIGVKTNQEGFIIVNEKQETSISGIYAAGDSTTASNKFAQLLTAGSEAIIAVEAITKELSR
ncbi:FAD-dependent oxidoreductase [bacterium]|nr:FAD-dependent oxidoreductase [bacterium]